MKIELHSNNSGYVIVIENSIKHNGEYSFINTQEFKLIEFLGELILDRKVKVEYR